jgi:hypothetical protein
VSTAADTKDTSRLTLEIPTDLLHGLKLKAVQKRISMRELITPALSALIADTRIVHGDPSVPEPMTWSGAPKTDEWVSGQAGKIVDIPPDAYEAFAKEAFQHLPTVKQAEVDRVDVYTGREYTKVADVSVKHPQMDTTKQFAPRDLPSARINDHNPKTCRLRGCGLCEVARKEKK